MIKLKSLSLKNKIKKINNFKNENIKSLGKRQKRKKKTIKRAINSLSGEVPHSSTSNYLTIGY